MWVRTLGTLGLAILVAACADNYATFVTSTDIGISADATTQDLHLGYVRTELFVGPAYPDKGEAPAAFGYHHSDLSIFSPKIKQLYATGRAAELVTQIEVPDKKPEEPDVQSGERRPLVFGTGTNLGLQVGFAGGTPSKVKFGFNREELSIIPLHREAPTDKKADKYAPVLAAIDMDQSLKSEAASKVKMTQFFATGAAARNIAKRPDIRVYFQEQASLAVSKAVDEDFAKAVKQRQTDYETIVAYFKGMSPSEFKVARDKLLKDSGLATRAAWSRLKTINDKEKFLDVIKENPLLTGTLAETILKT